MATKKRATSKKTTKKAAAEKAAATSGNDSAPTKNTSANKDVVEKEVIESINETEVKESSEDKPAETPVDSFFSQYLSNLANGNSKMAAVSLSNCYRAMLASKDEAVYKSVLDNFRDTKKFIVSKMLQGTTSLPVKDGAMVEVITTSFRMMILQNFTGKFNFKLIKSASKSEHFTTWFTKMTKK